MLIGFVIVISCALFTLATDDVVNLINEIGYPGEVHSVTTDDSYIMNIHRIRSSAVNSKTVIFMHGLASCGTQFILTGPGMPKAIGFMLADNGYDVWLANARGTEFSRNHKYLQPSSEKFWQFSWDEIAKYDLPAIIDYVLMKTNQTSLHYVGHSQGTTVVMAMLSKLPQYNKKFKTIHLMAPSIYFSNAPMLIKTAAAMFLEPVEDALVSAGLAEYPILPVVLRNLFAYVCSSKALIGVCKEFFYTFCGPSQHLNEAIFTKPFLDNVVRHLSSSASIMQFIHYAQIISIGGEKFLQFNHRKEINMLRYNQSTPPEYQLSNVRTKIHFLYGTTDYITNYQDVERIIEKFKPWTIGISKLTGYNHFDFIVAKNVDKFVNMKILDLMNRYNN